MTEPYLPDLRGVNLFFGFISMNASFTSQFVHSLFPSILEVEKLGGKTKVGEIHFGADIALARSRLFGGFLRSGCTHLMMIDDDMGWPYQAIPRMLDWNKEFLGVAGPKKMYPIQFAANKTDENGVKQLVNLTPETGLCEVNEVGMAFVLISRSCAEKMVDAYPELAYYADAELNELNYALFDPMMIPEGDYQRRYSEDYAFCKRWRDIGGKVELLADVRLEHTGTHTFAGAFIDNFMDVGPRDHA